VEKLRLDGALGEWGRSRDGAVQEFRAPPTVPVGLVSPAVSSQLLGPWLTVSSYEHLLMKYGSLGVGKPAAAAANSAELPHRRRASSNVTETDKEFDLIKTTAPLLNLQQQRRLRMCTHAYTDYYVIICNSVTY